jgi:uncharacterized membrane protein YeaQ/YmgE (transglycosylase-associated protein family)
MCLIVGILAGVLGGMVVQRPGSGLAVGLIMGLLCSYERRQ